MQENCQSGSEGGAKLTFVPTPILAQASAHARQLKGTSEHFSPERGQYLSPGFQPWVFATQKCALKVAREWRAAPKISIRYGASE